MTKQHQEINGVQWNQMAGAGVLPDIHGQDLLAIHDNFKFTSKNNKDGKDTIPAYNLYGTKKTHPIIEYIPSKEDSESATLTPSFVLEVTWPRIVQVSSFFRCYFFVHMICTRTYIHSLLPVQFYHPSSPRCQSLQSIYVSVARGIKRRSSRLPVEFHAVNCGAYREVCEQRFNVKSVPTIIGLKSGSIEGTEISLPGSMDHSVGNKDENEQDIEMKAEHIAHIMGIPLDAAKGKHAGNTFARPAIGQINKAVKTSIGGGTGSDEAPSIPLSEEVFHDAESSFLATLTSSLYSQFPTGRSLPPDTSRALAEFLDLIRWAHPPETKIHDLAEDLKLDFASVSMSEEGLMRAIRRHADLGRGITWSSRCGADAKGGYACGLWSLLHILSVGVAERHASVVGDADSVTVVHAGQVMRNFIDNFFVGCESCKKSWLELYDEASQSVDQLTGDKAEWHNLAIWIWEIHNEVTIRRDQSAGKGYHRKESRMASSSSLWPSKQDCPKCWQSLTDDTGLVMSMDSYDRNQLFQHLRKIYWPRGIHNNRLIVLERWSKAKRALSMKRLRARMEAHDWSISAMVLYLLVVCLILRIVFPRWSKQFMNRAGLFILRNDRRALQRKHKKKTHMDRYNNGNGAPQYLNPGGWDDGSHNHHHHHHHHHTVHRNSLSSTPQPRHTRERYKQIRYDNGQGERFARKSSHHRSDEGRRRRNGAGSSRSVYSNYDRHNPMDILDL